jgi:PilZ domain
MSMGGLFLKTPAVKTLESVVNLHFLVQEGQIRADASVKYVRRGAGLGMKFVAVSQEDRPRLEALMTRLRGLSTKIPPDRQEENRRSAEQPDLPNPKPNGLPG